MWRFFAALFLMPAAFAQVAGIQGNWAGTLNAGVTKLRIVLHVAPDGTAKLDSIDQGNMGVPVNDVKVIGTRISGQVPALGGSFEGELIDYGNKIQGKWKHGFSFPIVFARLEDPPGMRRPQMPRAPFPYRQEDVTLAGLTGVLTMPAGAGPFPAVVTIRDAGAQDRDGTRAGHKPFWVTADYLSRHGVAVLRADDAEGAVAYLKGRKDVGLVGLLGHGEGAASAMALANKSSDVAFVILLAGAIPESGEIRAPRQPVLALNGALDLEVAAAQNPAPLAQALEAAQNPDYEIVKLAGLNHLLQTAKTGAPEEYQTIEQTISPDVLEMVASWIARHSRAAEAVPASPNSSDR